MDDLVQETTVFCTVHDVAVGDQRLRAIGYARVSTAEQAEAGAGLAVQDGAVRAECERRGWLLVDLLTDRGISGKSLNGRPALQVALYALESGQAEVLVVAKLDRLSRSLLDFAGLMARAQKHGWNLVALDLGIDLSTPAGEFLANVMASAAQWERRIIGQRTREALEARRAAGVRLGRQRLIPGEVESRILVRRSAGASLATIAAELNEAGIATAHGGVRWYPSTVRAVVVSRS